MKKLWYIEYVGLWLGGKAVVRAETADIAVEILMRDECVFNNIEDLKSVVEIPRNQVILYNDNGNY